jgi:hypothetical protein
MQSRTTRGIKEQLMHRRMSCRNCCEEFRGMGDRQAKQISSCFPMQALAPSNV